MKKIGVRGGVAVALLCGVVFGLYPPAARAVYAQGGNAVFLIIFTTWVRAAALILLCAAGRKKIFQTRTDAREALIGGAFQAGSIACVFSALLFIPGSVMVTVMFTYTLMLLFFMAWRGEATLHADVVLSTLAAVLGISFVVDVWHADHVSWVGVGLAFAAALMTMSRVYVYGHLTKRKDPAVVGAEAFVVAALLVVPMALISWPLPPTTAWGWECAVLGALSLAAGTLFMFYGISILGSFRNSMFMKVEPLATSVFGVLVFHEYLQPLQYVGIVVVVGSLVVFQWRDHRRQHYLTTPALSDKTAAT